MGWDDVYQKVQLLERAAAVDGRHAGLLYQIGKCYELMGRYEEARPWFVRAKEEDVCPLRALDSMRGIVKDIAGEYGVPVVDAMALFEERTEDGIVGDEWLLDHVHPSIAGHQLLADSLYRRIEGMGLIRSFGERPAVREDMRRRHLSSLNEAYFAHGVERLQRVLQWSRGRIPGPEERGTSG